MQEELRLGLYALAIVCLGVLAAIFAWRGNGEAAIATAANIVSLLVRPPSMRGPSIPLPATVFACLLLVGCQSDPHAMEMGIRIGAQSVAPRPLAGYRVAAISLEPKASTPLSGEAGLWASSADGIPRLVDVAGNEYKAGAVGRGVSVGAPSGVALGQCWTDSTDSYKLYCKESGGNLAQRFSALAPGPIGCGGTPNTGCFTSLTSTATTILGDAAADVVTIKGALRVENAANTFYTALTTGAAANRAVAFPDAAGTVVLDSATQALTNKTIAYGSNTLTGVAPSARLINTTAPITGGGDLSADRTIALSIDSSLQVAGGALGVAVGSLVYARHTVGALAAPGIGTTYLVSPGQNASATEIFIALATRSSTVRRLYCFATTAPGGADSLAITVRKNGADTSITCTLTGVATTCNDTSNTATLSAGDRVSFKAVASAGSLAAGVTCSVEEGN